MTDVRNVVLVHGGFVDGSGWRGVYDLLTADGFNVSVVQNPTLSLDERRRDHPAASSTSRTARRSSSATPTAASSSPRPARTSSVAGLVYIAAFAPDAGESVNTLIADPPPGAPVPPILPPAGRLPVPRPRQVRATRSPPTCRPSEAAFMADSQVPWGVDALGGAVTEPAWRSKPSWYLVATDDRMIPPPAQRAMSERAGATVVEAPGSHAIYVSQPQATAELIKRRRPGGPRRRRAV